MPTRLAIQPHLPLDTLTRRARASNDPIARRHWPRGWWLAQALPSERVAAVTGYTVHWVRTMARCDTACGLLQPAVSGMACTVALAVWA
jgi:hypothetical protein